MSVKQIDGYKIYFNKKLGQGSYGTVYVAISDTTHEEVAVKMMPKKSSNYLNLFSWFWWISQSCPFQRN